MALSAGDIHRIADLGRIDISDEQVKVMQGELNDILTEGDNRTENMKNAPEKSEGYFLVPQVIE